MVWLRQQMFWLNISVECIIYIYRPKRDLNLTDVDFSPCRLVYRKGIWPEAIKRLPLNRWTRHKWVLLFFADHLVLDFNVDLGTMFSAMSTYNLDVVSPSYEQSEPPTENQRCWKFEVMKRHAEEPVGRLTEFLEWN